MIDTKELAIKLSNILNGLDSETSSVENPMSEYIFDVKTYGEHLDSFYQKEKKANVIPVFISEVNGDIQPIANVENISYGFGIVIYFPIYLKNKILDLKTFFQKCFVGQILNYGSSSGTAVSSISIPKITEFQRTQMKGLQEFIQDEYALPIDETQLRANLDFTLYLSSYKTINSDNTKTDLYLGNDISVNLTYGNLTEKGFFAGIGSSMNGDTQMQQLMTADFSRGLIKNTIYGDTFQLFVRKNAFWQYVLQQYYLHNFTAQNLQVEIQINGVLGLTSFNVVCQSLSFNFSWGAPIIAVLTFMPKAEIN